MTTLLKGKQVYLDHKYLHVELEDGRVISTPISWYRELQEASFQLPVHLPKDRYRMAGI